MEMLRIFSTTAPTNSTCALQATLREFCFHGHMHLDYLTDEYRIGTNPPRFFKWARRILVGLWVVYLAVRLILNVMATVFRLSIVV